MHSTWHSRRRLHQRCWSFHHLSIQEGSRRVIETRVIETNEFLAAVCDTERIQFWKNKGMWNSLQIIFSGDHFNDLGNYKL